jgi:uncharacterized membrane protein
MSINEKRIHQFFVLSVLLKGAHAVIECLGGILLAIVSTEMIVRFVNALTQDELVEDPHDFIATHLRTLRSTSRLAAKIFTHFTF